MKRVCFAATALFAALLSAPAARADWIAGAAGFWHDRGGGSHVGVGYAIRATANQAVAAAEEECTSSGPSQCKVIGPFSSGCLYIAVGHSNNGTVWGSGPSISDALNQCEDEGGTCKAPIGGCVSQ